MVRFPSGGEKKATGRRSPWPPSPSIFSAGGWYNGRHIVCWEGRGGWGRPRHGDRGTGDRLHGSMQVLRPGHGRVAEVGLIVCRASAGECWALVVAGSVAAFAVAGAVE